MTDDFKSSDTLIDSFDVEKMVTTNNIVDLYQEGNYLVGTTDRGTTFRQHIKDNKILNKNEKGEWILEELNYRA